MTVVESLIATIVSLRSQQGHAGEMKYRHFSGDYSGLVSNKKGRYAEGTERGNPTTQVAYSRGKDLGKKSNSSKAG